MKLLLQFVFLLVCYTTQAQVWGTITDETGEPLSFATIYIQNTTNGTTSNINGDYTLLLGEGTYQIVFQYVGYEQQVKTVIIEDEKVELDVQLLPQSVNLSEVEVTAGGEDPAYEIIRKARKKRKYYLNQLEQYSYDAYMKGNQRVEDVPEKIFGMDIGDMGGILDTTGSGIVYLSESISKVYYQVPDKYKEVMISSKISGDDNGFSFNQASAVDFNFYQNSYNGLGKRIISPIGKNAFAFYKYKLEGAFVDKSGQLVNKIKVIRKKDTDPTLSGYIYINEGLWNVHSVDMKADGKALNISMLDSVRIQQVSLPVQEPDVWKPFSSTVSFDFKVFGITIAGVFTGVFTNYNLNPNLDDSFFGNQVLKVEENANQKDSSYWEAIRPVPLTKEEVADYNKKDSLKVIWASKEFTDSLDRRSNKFGFGSLLSGYTYTNTHKGWSLNITSPLMAINYNTVQGYYPMAEMSFVNILNRKKSRFYKIGYNSQYGFSDKKFRGNGNFAFNFNNTNRSRIYLEGGRMLGQFDERNSTSTLFNTLYSLVLRRNYAKFYDKIYGKARYTGEVYNGFFLDSSVEYANRKGVRNQSDHSWFYRKTRIFSSNNPQAPQDYETLSLEAHKALTLDVKLKIKINQQYLSYPNSKFNLGSKYPTLDIHYQSGIPVLGADTDFHFLSLAAKDFIPFGTLGTSGFRAELGAFLGSNRTSFIDYHHFNSDPAYAFEISQTLDKLRLLPSYQYSSLDSYGKLQWEHSFEGFLLGRVPWVRYLQGSLILGNNVLYSKPTGWYNEFIVGIADFRPLRVFRIDFVTQLQEGRRQPAYRIMLGVGL